jgi:hypothetical protein
VPKIAQVVSGQPIASAWGNSVAAEANLPGLYSYLTGDTQPVNGGPFVTVVGSTNIPAGATAESRRWSVLWTFQNHPSPPYTNTVGYARLVVNGGIQGEYAITVPLPNTSMTLTWITTALITSCSLMISGFLCVSGRLIWIDGGAYP